ncbi:transcriptional regulator MraZ [Capnocytophaga stomatis]|uniref:Transcriptional regulator MraZ n=1 Tax=Capnocytophaga stomatis TaxID=1848904 RepID=A0A250FX34_9FLAO|nr:division/cell wall cluster transcriptional repressor MraZ [Capnocytophaga stomatis]ATA89719.1 division/cell wall cluster transcriptional repressor MraZ [Capnocytophaga stomatis]GIJ94696.1 transcriptional regulator MraZ [Capnocytophaga stomatis]GIJ97424.1 transcriptional regulator MraZ [Capnocytophaga stomatis]GIM49134.1 transcriptional regulator MraZ [Capnocytophaga stomatis]
MGILIGTYECKIDAKGRITLPAPLKKQLGDLEAGFVLKRSDFQRCIDFYTMDEWNLEMQKVNSLNRYVKENNDFIRKFMSGVKLIEIDSVGRMLVPKDLLEYAQIDKEIVMSALGNRVEIWDKTAYETAIYTSPEDFSALAEKVMGGLGND